MSFWCLQIDQKTNEIFVSISALAPKKRSNQKKGTLYVALLDDFILALLNYFFDLISYSRLGQKSLQKFRWFFGQFEDTKKKSRN